MTWTILTQGNVFPIKIVILDPTINGGDTCAAWKQISTAAADFAEENFGLGLLPDYRSTEFRGRLDINITSVIETSWTMNSLFSMFSERMEMIFF